MNYTPCECTKMCQYTSCRYRQCGFLVSFSALGTTTSNTVSMQGKACGGSFPLVAESNGAVLTNANVTAGTVYRVYPQSIGGILRGVVQGL